METAEQKRQRQNACGRAYYYRHHARILAKSRSPEEAAKRRMRYLKTREKGMGWNNRRQWHLDHIIPLAAWDLSNTENQKAALHYSNLRPVWNKVNLEKGHKIDLAVIKQWKPQFTQPRLIRKATELLKEAA